MSKTQDWPVIQRYVGLECPFYQFFGLLSRKWALDVIYHLRVSDEPVRFRELKRRVQNAATIPLSTKELTARLRDLEIAGLVERTVYDEIVPHVEYNLTPRGRSLIPHMERLYEWVTEIGD